MLRSTKEMIGYTLSATDGEIGRVKDFLFDDRDWRIRYLVADTGTWLLKQCVLLAPDALVTPDWKSKRLSVNLTKDEIESAPPLDDYAPVSRQYEMKLAKHYRTAPYWTTASPIASVLLAASIELNDEDPCQEQGVGNGHLRSMSEVCGYSIKARDGEIGHVEEFVVDDVSWNIRYMVVDTRNLLPSPKVLVSPQWIDNVQLANERVKVDLRKSTVQAAPEYDPSTPVNRQFETQLYDYYGRPHYWVEHQRN